jgi:PBP1b-binding outer membrane lipoprotein LpoB
MRLLLAMLLPLFLLLSGCVTPPQAPLAAIPARQVETQKVTLGNVQMVVKKGASNADVIGALSSPNIVTTNNDGTETWVYDKIMTEAEYAEGRNTSVAVKSTRTMIVVIKFDKFSKVETVQYRQTSY